MIKEVNLNLIEPNIWEDNYYKGRPINYKNNNIEVVFQNLENFIINKINEADAITGCMAWLTNFKIIDAMSKKEQCQIVVQKEDFLRPDYKYNNTKQNYYEQYSKIKGINKFSFDVNLDVCCGDPDIEGVRCVGNYNIYKTPKHPKMHHKFIVLHKQSKQMLEGTDWSIYKPYGIITGSFNYTHNGTYSLENIVYIEDKDISKQYQLEYIHILSLSESLNWNSVWVEPDYRFGT